MIIKYVLIIACVLSFISYIYAMIKRNNNSNCDELQLKTDIYLEYTIFLLLNLCMVLIPTLITVFIVFSLVIWKFGTRVLYMGHANHNIFVIKSQSLGLQTSMIIWYISTVTFLLII